MKNRRMVKLESSDDPVMQYVANSPKCDWLDVIHWKECAEALDDSTLHIRRWTRT